MGLEPGVARNYEIACNYAIIAIFHQIVELVETLAMQITTWSDVSATYMAASLSEITFTFTEEGSRI